MAHGAVIARGKEEGDADGVERLLHDLRLGVDLDAQRLEHIGAAAAAGDGSVAVLGHGDAGAGDDEGRGGGDVEGAAVVTAGAAGVEHGLADGLDAEAAAAHGAGGAGEFLDRLAFGGHGGEEGGRLGLGQFAGQNGVDGLGGRFGREVAPAEQLGEEGWIVHGAPIFRKLRNMRLPMGVMIDSGWNWMPSRGRVRWRMPMISPSSARAETTSSAGRDSASSASEW